MDVAETKIGADRSMGRNESHVKAAPHQFESDSRRPPSPTDIVERDKGEHHHRRRSDRIGPLRLAWLPRFGQQHEAMARIAETFVQGSLDRSTRRSTDFVPCTRPHRNGQRLDHRLLDDPSCPTKPCAGDDHGIHRRVLEEPLGGVEMVCIPLPFDDHIAEPWAKIRVVKDNRFVSRWVWEFSDAVGVRAVAEPASPIGGTGDRNIDVDTPTSTVRGGAVP